MHVCVSMYGYVNVRTGTHQRHWIPLELQLKAFVISLT